ncbi:hypothetical protein WOLCODRAFT_126429 [Wolfiporia cocos MD-104 SS10]|uniref:Trafficking protein particle complex II-specific subunit 65 IgD3 domain-containing protein n=1 Tax=Wolfiporia cocos (strain MD-104) TaxID=742152 RepID=A0A2H3J1T3_WOLCO|nr:hypothetical protein WOLCODRAFT_126429 [Wolfiporia cocos MD-104 SS10]
MNLLAAAHPSIFPPSTPHPIPSAAESDRQYVQAQGTPLSSGVWGEQVLGSSRESTDAFALLWARDKREWVAVYRMSVLVRFMTTKFADPLLSLTVSTTLREKPLPITPPRRALAALIDAAGGIALDPTSPVRPNGPEDDSANNAEDDDTLAGFVEVNLLEGLQADPTFSSPSDPPLSLPSTRLGLTTRRTAFSLPPSSAQVVSAKPYPSTATTGKAIKPSAASATFRKSYRKTMKIVSGFHVRMRTVFVPYFLLPEARKKHANKKKPDTAHPDSDLDDSEDALQEREQREAGNEEHTVVLSVEIENLFPDIPSSAWPNYHFSIERADVSVSGTGAKTMLVGWGDGANVFPLHIGPREQMNLLYAVSFLRAPEVDEFTLATTSSGPAGKRASLTSAAQDVRRSVSINISVRPFERASGDSTGEDLTRSDESLIYPTRAYASYWSCKLNFSSASAAVTSHAEVDVPEQTVLPTPASPFPTTPAPALQNSLNSPNGSRISLQQGQLIAGNKRFTLSALDALSPDSPAARKALSPINYQSPIAMLNPANQPQSQTAGPTTPTSGLPNTFSAPTVRGAYMPPSVAQASYTRSPTTYGLPSPHDPYFSFAAHTDSLSPGGVDVEPATPRTPAYPAYPGSPPPIPPTPFWQAPLAQQSAAGTVGPSVEMRRDRGGQGALPTPGLNVAGFPLGLEVGAEIGTKVEAGGQPIIVSVGLLPIAGKGKGRTREPGEIYPLDRFTLDIFVFNQSSWTRRFEISHPEERRRRRKGRGDGGRKGEVGAPGILPLENRVRIGPLLPSTCQSVRMDFLALTPGVHPVEELLLTDVQSGFTMHLRSVMDIVVHEPHIDSTTSLEQLSLE